MSKAAQLKQLLDRPGTIVAPGVYDGISAKIVARAGFEAAYTTGGGISRSHGLPDLGLLTETEVLLRVKSIVEAGNLPLVVDIDTGYGNALNVMRTIRDFETIGVGAVHLEDQVTPKRCGHLDGKELVSLGEMVGKLRAAVDARRDPNLQIIARTDARAVEGFDAAIARARAYRDAGADILFFEAPQTIEEIREVPRRLEGPLLFNRVTKGGKTPLVPIAQLGELGYKIIIVPQDLQMAALYAMQEVARALRETGSTDHLMDRMLDFKEREELVNSPAYFEAQRRYMNQG